MGISATVGSIILCTVNSIVFLVSIILFGVGVAIVSGFDVFINLLDTIEDDLVSASSSAGVDDLNTDNLTLAKVILPVGWILIILSILIGVMCILGYIGAYCRIKVILIVYSVVLAILILVQIVNAVAFSAYQDAYGETVKPYLRQYTIKNYAGIEGTDEDSLIWNSVMVYFDCCGIDGYTDFTDLANWPPATIDGTAVTDLETPVLCCKTHSTDYTCAKTGSSTTANNWRDTGCYEKIHDDIIDSAAFISGFIILLLFQIACFVIALVIICTMDNTII